MQETVYICSLVPLLPLLGFAAGLWAHVIPEYCSQKQRTELKEHSWLETKPWFVSSSQAGHFCRVYETPGHCVCECNVCMCVTGSLEFNSDTCTKTQNLPEAQPAATCHASTAHMHTHTHTHTHTLSFLIQPQVATVNALRQYSALSYSTCPLQKVLCYCFVTDQDRQDTSPG